MGPARGRARALRDVDARSLERYDRALVGFGTRHTLSSQNDPRARHRRGARLDPRGSSTQIAATSGGRMTVELQSYVQPPAPRIPTPTTITNVVATLRGTDPASADRVYVVGAHYDSRVTDVLDATERRARAPTTTRPATSAVLELARVMAPRPTEATIVFVAFAGEEQGLYGSTHFAELAQAGGLEHPGRPEHGHHRQPGRRQRRCATRATIRLFSEGVPTSETPRADGAAAVDRRRERRHLAPARALRQGDRREPRDAACGSSSSGAATASCAAATRSRSSSAAGRRCASREPHENFDHQHQDVRVENGKQFGDLPEFVDFRYLARVTRVVGSSLAALARSPRAPSNARMITAALSYDTELRWDANPEPDVVGYEVVWRDSTEPLWTHARRVGNVTAATIAGLNKDDNQVGVRAIDRDGNRSPVAYPVPASG